VPGAGRALLLVDVTAPRIIVPGATYALTRRTAFRKMFWTPSDPVIHDGLLYCFALAQEETEIELHSGTMLPNHGHWSVTPKEPNLPEFTEYVFRESSKFLMNALVELGCEAPENVWNAGRPHQMRLIDAEAQLVWLLYTAKQAVDAGIVERAADYPGWWTDPGMLRGRTIIVKKPPLYFGKKRPAELPLRFTCPPLLRETFGDPDKVIHWLRKELERAERACKARGGVVLGAEACTRQHPWAEPKTPRTGFRQRIPSFLVATSGPEGDILRARCAEETTDWRLRHEDRRTKWKAGDRTVAFPYGTYGFRVRHGAHVEPPPEPGSYLINAPGPGVLRESVKNGALSDTDRNQLHECIRQAADIVTPKDDTLAARLHANEPHTVDRPAQPHPHRQDPHRHDPESHPPRRTVTRGRGKRRGRHLPVDAPHGAADPADIDNPLADVARPDTPSHHPVLRLDTEPDPRRQSHIDPLDDDDPNPPPT
jgi:hypothetical protein